VRHIVLVVAVTALLVILSATVAFAGGSLTNGTNGSDDRTVVAVNHWPPPDMA
jgi:hypothetical protein